MQKRSELFGFEHDFLKCTEKDEQRNNNELSIVEQVGGGGGFSSEGSSIYWTNCYPNSIDKITSSKNERPNTTEFQWTEFKQRHGINKPPSEQRISRDSGIFQEQTSCKSSPTSSVRVSFQHLSKSDRNCSYCDFYQHRGREDPQLQLLNSSVSFCSSGYSSGYNITPSTLSLETSTNSLDVIGSDGTLVSATSSSSSPAAEFSSWKRQHHHLNLVEQGGLPILGINRSARIDWTRPSCSAIARSRLFRIPFSSANRCPNSDSNSSGDHQGHTIYVDGDTQGYLASLATDRRVVVLRRHRTQLFDFT